MKDELHEIQTASVELAKDIDTDRESAFMESATPLKIKLSKKRKHIALSVAVLIVVAGIAAVCFSPFGRYLRAKELMDSGDYSAAYRAFKDLGDLGDAPERKQEAEHMREVEETYQLAETNYQSGAFINAYRDLQEIEDENYEGISELKENIISAMYEQMLEYSEKDEMLLVRFYLRLLEDEDSLLVDGFWENLSEEKHMELDTSYYDAMNQDHITSFNSSTTAEEYATVIKYMYLNSIPSLTLQINGGKPYYDTINSRSLMGTDLADAWLPEYASVYNVVWWFEYDGNNRITKVSLEIGPSNAQSTEEASQHMEEIKAYCQETVRMLNDELFITNSMSNQAKALVILDWVCNYLDYDDSLEIHDAFMAIQNEIGVCESYVAIYNYMCNLAGVPTYGQIGFANSEDEGSPADASGHIWSVQLDEAGNVFYTDPTWADSLFTGNGITRSGFIEHSQEIAASLIILNMDESALLDPESSKFFAIPDYQYFWQEALWDSHEPCVDFKQIQASYLQNTD